MNYKMIGRIIAPILAVEAAFMLPALLICLSDGDLSAAYAILHTILIIAAAAAGLWAGCRKAPKGFRSREGLICVGLSWIIVSPFGCLPFVLSGQIPRLQNAAVLACFNNIGPGLETVGPACNYASYSVFSKLVLIVNMLAGRLEIYPILALFSGSARERVK